LQKSQFTTAFTKAIAQPNKALIPKIYQDMKINRGIIKRIMVVTKFEIYLLAVLTFLRSRLYDSCLIKG